RVPIGDGNSRDVKWIGRRRNRAAEGGTTTAKPGCLHELAICVVDVARATVWIGKGFDGCAELPLQLQPGHENLLAPVNSRDGAKIGVSSCMGAKVEPVPVQCPYLLPGHPRMANAFLPIPERHEIGADPSRDNEE